MLATAFVAIHKLREIVSDSSHASSCTPEVEAWFCTTCKALDDALGATELTLEERMPVVEVLLHFLRMHSIPVRLPKCCDCSSSSTQDRQAQTLPAGSTLPVLLNIPPADQPATASLVKDK